MTTTASASPALENQTSVANQHSEHVLSEKVVAKGSTEVSNNNMDFPSVVPICPSPVGLTDENMSSSRRKKRNTQPVNVATLSDATGNHDSVKIPPNISDIIMQLDHFSDELDIDASVTRSQSSTSAESKKAVENRSSQFCGAKQAWNIHQNNKQKQSLAVSTSYQPPARNIAVQYAKTPVLKPTFLRDDKYQGKECLSFSENDVVAKNSKLRSCAPEYFPLNTPKNTPQMSSTPSPTPNDKADGKAEGFAIPPPSYSSTLTSTPPSRPFAPGGDGLSRHGVSAVTSLNFLSDKHHRSDDSITPSMTAIDSASNSSLFPSLPPSTVRPIEGKNVKGRSRNSTSATPTASSPVNLGNSYVPACRADDGGPPDVFLVLDFEATCYENPWPKDFTPEIIEFPVVAVDTRQKTIIGEFHSYVRPIQYPQLTNFCKQLTGITQDVVDAAPSLPEVIQQFEAWLPTVLAPFTKGGRSPSVCLATDGPWDLRDFMYRYTILPYYFDGDYFRVRKARNIIDGDDALCPAGADTVSETTQSSAPSEALSGDELLPLDRRKYDSPSTASCEDSHLHDNNAIETPSRRTLFSPLFFRWIDIKESFAKFVQCRHGKIKAMLEFIGQDFEGRLHSGIDDSRNIAKIVIWMLDKRFGFPFVDSLEQSSLDDYKEGRIMKNHGLKANQLDTARQELMHKHARRSQAEDDPTLLNDMTQWVYSRHRNEGFGYTSSALSRNSSMSVDEEKQREDMSVSTIKELEEILYHHHRHYVSLPKARGYSNFYENTSHKHRTNVLNNSSLGSQYSAPLTPPMGSVTPHQNHFSPNRSSFFFSSST